MKALVVGGGVMGLATAWGLARAGHTVELFEQGPLPNPLASSVDQHRLIRHPYGDRIGYARMIDEAYAAWDLLWRDLGQRFYAETGTLALSGNGDTWAERSAAALAHTGRRMEELPLAELPGRFPQIDPQGVERAFWMATGGVLFAQDIVAALAGHLARQGKVTLHALTPIAAVDLEHGRAVTSAGHQHDADVVVVAAGAWIPRLVPDRRLVPSRQVVLYFDLPADQRPTWAKSPIIIDKTAAVGLYLAPPVEGRGLKIGDHTFSRRGDPSAERSADEREMQALLGRCRVLIRDFARWRIDRLAVCFYTVTEDERFVVEKHGARGWLMSPCSGHGFKFGALMGLRLAEAIATGSDPAAHARWAAGLEDDKPS
jgi:glycine/D-amino acid oxidase-like deaminating enzyme